MPRLSHVDFLFVTKILPYGNSHVRDDDVSQLSLGAGSIAGLFMSIRAAVRSVAPGSNLLRFSYSDSD